MKIFLVPFALAVIILSNISPTSALNQSAELKSKDIIDTPVPNSYLDFVTELGSIVIDSTPKGSKVLIKGEVKGRTPVELKLKAGEYEVILEYPGYRPWHFQTTIIRNKRQEISVDLEKVGKKALDTEKPDLRSKEPDKKAGKEKGVSIEGQAIPEKGPGKNISTQEIKAGQVWSEPVTGMDFIWVPSGCYEMGCGDWTDGCDDDESPAHEVCVDGFWMGKTEVTQAQWNKLRENNPSEFQKGDNYPVDRVSWNEAKSFAEDLAEANKGVFFFRLPTEAEWEYACRSGGKPEKYAGGGTVDESAWYAKNSQDTTHPVETKRANGLGLHDMCGNVYEWCEDKYSHKAYEIHERNNPVYTGDESRRVGRGGCWRYSAPDVRCSFRNFCLPGLRFHHLGFRLVRTK